jgi:hypothetical protein
MISKADLEVVVAGELDRYAGDIGERTAEIIVERNRADRSGWSTLWRSAMSGGGLARFEAEVRRQVAEMIDGGDECE